MGFQLRRIYPINYKEMLRVNVVVTLTGIIAHSAEVVVALVDYKTHWQPPFMVLCTLGQINPLVHGYCC